MARALADSGTAAHVADAKKGSPGAQTTESQMRTRCIQFRAAGGGRLANRCEAKLGYVTPDGKRRCAVFQGAAVGMQSLYITEIVEADTLAAFDTRGGYRWHRPTNTDT